MKEFIFAIILVSLFSCKNHDKNHDRKKQKPIETIAILKTNNTENDTIAHAFNIAIGDIYSNIRPIKQGLLKHEAATLFAGIDYFGPWTRDASVNVYNAAGFLFPGIAKNTLIAQMYLDTAIKKVRVSGQYWDSPLWIIGAWELYLNTGEKRWLKMALGTSIAQLEYLEKTEFDYDKGLFRGASFFNDGISAYPDIYTKTGVYKGADWVSDITKWVEENPDKRISKGFGLPMMALSTNCIYYKAYTLIDSMAKALETVVPSFNASLKAKMLRKNINAHFWDSTTQKYLYLIDPNGNCNYQEGAGIAMAILFGVADKKQCDTLFANTHIEPAGIPCLYPSFPRYVNKRKTSYGRHSGTIWTQVNGFWALAAAKYERYDIFNFEFSNIARFAYRDKQFREMYHPITGIPYGGIQETNNNKIEEWKSAERQVWGAASYVALVVKGLFGLMYCSDGLRFKPLVEKEYENLRLLNVPYHNAILNIYIKGTGNKIRSFKVNGIETSAFISNETEGLQHIEIVLQDDPLRQR